MEFENLEVKQVLFNGTEPAFVEFYSNQDSRNHIIAADRFIVMFGWSIDDLKAHGVKHDN